MPTPNNISTDLRGIGNLTVDAVRGISDIVESMHQTIISCGGLLSEGNTTRTKGITGMVYRNISTITELVGGSIDRLLDRLSMLIGDTASSPAREAAVSALNGVLGDHLATRNNPLAISMQFRRDGRPLDKQGLLERIEQSDGRLAIMIHGSCMNDLLWERNGHDHGAALEDDLGIRPLYLHYNSGLHISDNGRNLADQLETLVQLSPAPLELHIIAHSMGGLVLRSACHFAEISCHDWQNQLQKVVFLGSPHHGAMLEKGGNWITLLTRISPYSAPFARLGKIRSAGITDLRYGHVLEDDWKGRDRFEFSGDRRKPCPLPSGLQCYAIAATTAARASKLGDHLLGDGLVTVNSALGRHTNPELDLAIPEKHQWIGRNMNHLDLLDHPEVFNRIKTFLGDQSNPDI